MKKVHISESCWEWIGAKDKGGYGKFSVGNSRDANGKRINSMVSAHRYSYELFVGQIPIGSGFHGTCVLHSCDNPSCVNPSHLFLGTNADNVADMDRKGRRVNSQPRGSDHGSAALSEQQAVEIFNLAVTGDLSMMKIANMFGVSKATVSHIKSGRNWAHLTGASRK